MKCPWSICCLYMYRNSKLKLPWLPFCMDTQPAIQPPGKNWFETNLEKHCLKFMLTLYCFFQNFLIKKYVKMLQTAYWLKWPKCKYQNNCGPDVSILAGPSAFDKGPARTYKLSPLSFVCHPCPCYPLFLSCLLLAQSFWIFTFRSF